MTTRTHPFDVVAFDLDGTLVDTTALHVASSQAATRQIYGTPAPTDLIARSLGRPLTESMEILAGERGQLDDLILAFMDYYAAHQHDGAQLFNGVDALLRDLRSAGVASAVLSNKLRAWGQSEITRLGIAGLFDLAVFMEDMPAPKPSGLALRPVLERLAVKPGRVLVIGDSPGDVVCAQSAGAGAGAALWGVVTAAPLLATRPDYQFASLAAVRRLFGLAG